MFSKKEDERDEAELVKQVKPLLEQAERIMHETMGAVKGADPDNRLSNQSKRNVADHKATPEEQRLAEALKVVSRIAFYLNPSILMSLQQMIQEVGGTLDWAKDKLDSFPKAKKDLGPLLDAVSRTSPILVIGVAY